MHEFSFFNQILLSLFYVSNIFYYNILVYLRRLTYIRFNVKKYVWNHK